MKKLNKLILPISLISVSIALISIDKAFSCYLNKVDDITINISKEESNYYTFTINNTNSLLTSAPTCILDINNIQFSNFYITGSFCDWNRSSSIKMIKDGTNDAVFEHIYLEEGINFKITDFSTYYGYSNISSGNNSYFTNDSNDNMVVSKSGYYDFYLKDGNIYINNMKTETSYDYAGIDVSINKDSYGDITSYTYRVNMDLYDISTTRMIFLDTNKNRIFEDIMLSDLTNNKEYNLTGKYVYLYPDSSIWGQANAWFLLKYDSNYSKFIECTNYSGYYKASVGLNVTSVDFYRMNPNNTFENITSGSENLDTVKWNLITGITLSNENYFKINGWSSYKTTAKLVNEPDYILE